PDPHLDTGREHESITRHAILTQRVPSVAVADPPMRAIERELSVDGSSVGIYELNRALARCTDKQWPKPPLRKLVDCIGAPFAQADHIIDCLLAYGGYQIDHCKLWN